MRFHLLPSLNSSLSFRFKIHLSFLTRFSWQPLPLLKASPISPFFPMLTTLSLSTEMILSESHMPPVLITIPQHCRHSTLSSTEQYTRTVFSLVPGPHQPTGRVLIPSLPFPMALWNLNATQCVLCPSNAHPAAEAQEKPHHSPFTW